MQDKAHAAQLGDLVRTTLDRPLSPEALARQTAHSRAGFFRLFQALLEESPVAMRRRFLLERAAWELSRTQRPVTEIAFDAGYQSLEGFSRAFAKAYRISPSVYRRSGTWSIHLPAPNEFHFIGPCLARAHGSKRQSQHPSQHLTQQGGLMDLFELFQGTDSWYTKRLLEAAAKLTDEQLDRPAEVNSRSFGWEKPDHSLREILERMVLTKEVWTAALTNGPMPPLENPRPEQRTPQALLQRFQQADASFARAFQEIRDRNAWDETFVDALCEPPETFTFGGTFAHVMTFNAQRRLNALDALHRLGVPIEGIGCPMEYETELRRRP